jgi:monovalent cation:H+ antiporter-2, CPA2 family
MTENFANILILMAVAVAAVWLFKRINLPPILAYLFCGILAGPNLMSLFEHPEEMNFFAEIGIVFLLFSLGLEFSLPKMLAMRHLVFGVGLGQMAITTSVFTLLATLFGFELKTALVIGSMAALSSTAIVIKQSSELGILNTARGQMAVSILLFQDLAVVPLLIIIPLLSDGANQGLGIAISMAIVKGVVVVAILMSAGKWVLPFLFREVARTRTDELYVLATSLVTLMAAGLTYSFGLSMALGAFLAGMMLGESQYRHQLEADIRPFRDILMGLFFITLGMRLNLGILVDQWYWALLGVVVLISVKILLIRFSAWLFRAAELDAWAAGVKLCQMGEFSFVVAALAVNHGLMSNAQSSLFLTIGVLSMALTPYLVDHSLLIAKRLSNQVNPTFSPDPQTLAGNEKLSDHVLIFGFGRVGQSVSRMLKLEAIPYLSVDSDPIRVQESRLAGESIYFGDVSQKDILRAVGIDTAKLVLLTFDEPAKALKVVQSIAALRPELPIVVRTRKDHQLEELYQAGASQVVPEILEGSLMLVSQVLHLSGVPMSRILKRVRKERKGRYGHMHGFFPGETTEVNFETQVKLEFMHAVILTADAYGVGKTLGSLQLENSHITIKGLRRDNKEIPDPDGQTTLAIGDVLVISGKPRRVERTERFLLEGH